jgi:hypothetical protein
MFFCRWAFQLANITMLAKVRQLGASVFSDNQYVSHDQRLTHVSCHTGQDIQGDPIRRGGAVAFTLSVLAHVAAGSFAIPK